MKSSVIIIFSIFVVLLFGLSSVSPCLAASKAYLTPNEREALKTRTVLFELRQYNDNGSLTTQKMMVTYGEALEIWSQSTPSKGEYITNQTMQNDEYFDGIISNKNCKIFEDTMGCVNLFLGTSIIASRVNLYLFAKYNYPGITSYDLLGITFSLGGILLSLNGSRSDDFLLGLGIVRIYIGFVGLVANYNLIAGFTDNINSLLIPCPIKFEQMIEGRALIYLAIGTPFSSYSTVQ
jgi:hypothetical protein